MSKIILRIILVLLMLAIIALYVYDLAWNHTPPTKHLFRTMSIVFLCLAGLVRMKGPGRYSLKFYDAQFNEILRDAFTAQPFWRNKLLCAVRLYNENKLKKAIKYLSELKPLCQTGADHYAVNLFTALGLTDMHLYDQAEHVYRQLINMNLEDSRVYSNMGQVQMRTGNVEKALQSYERALEYDSGNAFAYNNIAQAHFQMYKFSEAIPFALKALEINPKMHQSASLLTVIYALEDNKTESDKYFHIAVCSGVNPQELQQTIEFFRINKPQNEPEET